MDYKSTIEERYRLQICNEKKELEKAGFVNRGGKGNHRNFVRPNVMKPITILGKMGADALYYQEQNVKKSY